MQIIQKLIVGLDNYQQKHTVLAFPFAVIKRYGDDQAGKHAALITYYGFLSLFPLLLIFITLLGLLVSHNSNLETQIISNTLQYFPALGDDLRDNVSTGRSSGLALIIGVLVLIYGARGLASCLQDTFNSLWHVEKKVRPGFVGLNMRNFGMMFAVGFGIVTGTTLSYILRGIVNTGISEFILLTMINILLTFGLFLAVFRLGTSHTISLQKLKVGAVIAGVGTIIIQHFGGYIMASQLPHLNNSYGSFALALGIMFWIYLQAQVIIYALEITIVRAEKDYPQSLLS